MPADIRKDGEIMQRAPPEMARKNIEINVIATIIISAIFACLIGALIPGIQAARRRPAEILQVDQL